MHSNAVRYEQHTNFQHFNKAEAFGRMLRAYQTPEMTHVNKQQSLVTDNFCR